MPVFFVAIGLAADLRTVGPVLPLAVALLVVAVVGKLIGSGAGAALAGMGVRESSLVGIGMIARGEVALVAATVGLRSGAIDESIYAVIVLVSVGRRSSLRSASPPGAASAVRCLADARAVRRHAGRRDGPPWRPR